MTEVIPIETDRLILRAWRDADRAPFAALNADPEVMRYFPKPLTRAESDELVDRISAMMADNGWGWYAVEVKGGPTCIGMVGLNVPHYPIPGGPNVEVGWRLSRDSWGRGFATEAAKGCLDYGFGRLGLPEIIAFTAVPNTPSRAVMQRLGMTRDPADDFDHPLLEAGHPLQRHVLYRIDAARWAGLSDR